jgi:hypothetical protein
VIFYSIKRYAICVEVRVLREAVAVSGVANAAVRRKSFAGDVCPGSRRPELLDEY